MTPAEIRAALSGNMENLLAAVTPGGIELQEKRGQIEQSFSNTLPLELQGGRANFEKLGFVFGLEYGLFVDAKFPDGWRKKPTDHAMWTEIVDEKGRKRGMIFYKAAFYDQRAHAFLESRFLVENDYGDKERNVWVADACGKVDKRISGLQVPKWSGDRAEAERLERIIYSARQELTEWLNTNYPDWESPLAYWTE
jgi:hypothetical protein